MIDWGRVQDLFLAAADMPTGARSAFLQQECGNDAVLLEEVSSLLASDRDSVAYLQAVVQEEAARIFDTEVLVGERLGMYRILREIGRGGMGTVYLALRDDAEYSKEVAIKSITRGMNTHEVLERFRFERQVLANLEHPYIARLFDGGSTEDGLPFFVMEYVSGMPVDVYCRDQRLNVEARCELFLKILEGVSYAHRNLIIHRDLKPANILVTMEGVPKLLDFGVAKLLDADANTVHTRDPMLRPFTPGYASPEQVRGLPMSTATDVYALGAILYELLTGKRAQTFATNTPAEIERVICESEIPHAAVVGVPYDLLTIVQMAMHKAPARRYESAQQFAEDIQRFLENRPVRARRDAASYRLRKFLVRNKITATAVTIAVLSLFAGLGISIEEAKNANRARRAAEAQEKFAIQQTKLAEAARNNEAAQRQLADAERDDANQQRALAEERVNDMLGLANHALLDVHDAIAPLPGALAARQALVQTTLTYLNSLQGRVGLDDNMRSTLSAAYYKVAKIQGDPESSSLQQVQEAEKSLNKAQELLAPVYRNRPNDPEVLLRWIQIRSDLARFMYRGDRVEQGLAMQKALVPLAAKLGAMQPQTLAYRGEQVELDQRLANELLPTDIPQARKYALQGIVLARELVEQYPDDKAMRQTYGTMLAVGAAAYRSDGHLEEAAKLYKQSIESREELMRHNPNDMELRRNLMVAYGNYATMLGVPWSPNINRPEEARLYAAKGVVIARESVARDANDVTARYDLGMILSRAGMIDPANGESAKSLATLQEAQSLIEPVARSNSHSSANAGQLGVVLEYEGHRLEALGRNAEARSAYERSIEVLRPFLGTHNGTVNSQYLADEEALALLEANMGATEESLATARKALKEAEAIYADSQIAHPQMAIVAQGWSVLALVQQKAGDREAAKESLRMARKSWETVKVPGALTAYRKLLEELQKTFGEEALLL